MRVLAEGKAKALRDFCEEASLWLTLSRVAIHNGFQNFISFTTVRDITSLREDLSSALYSAGFIPRSSSDSTTDSPHPALVCGILMAGLYPRVARITLPSSAIKFDKVQSGAVQREQEAKQYKIFDLDSGEGDGRGNRVFLHPSSVLFGEAKWKEPIVCYFRKAVTTKPFLRDATEVRARYSIPNRLDTHRAGAQVPLYALLLFGGPISINHVAGGLTIGGPGKTIRLRLKAWPRIGVLVNQLRSVPICLFIVPERQCLLHRRLLDAQLAAALETTSLVNFGRNNPVLEAMLALLTKEGF
jgi:ATP-dependent RNA helicase DHX57